MTTLSRSSRLIILCATVILFISFVLSIDNYSKTYRVWNHWLTELKLSSHRIDSAVAVLRSGSRVDYDALSREDKIANNIANELAQLANAGVQIDRFLGVPYGLALNGFTLQKMTDKHEYIAETALQDKALVLQRADIIEQFKTHFSVLRNSEHISVELINEIRRSPETPQNLLQQLDKLELLLLMQLNVPDEIDHSKTLEKLAQIQNDYRNKNAELEETLSFIEMHITIINERAPLIDSLIAEELALSEQIQEKILYMQKGLLSIYQAEKQRALKFLYLFGTVGLGVLFYGGWQARQAYLMARKIKQHNIELEQLIEQRTRHLESARDHLQSETVEREKVIQQLEASQEKLDSVVNSIDGCVYEYSFEQECLTFASIGVEKIWDIPISEVYEREPFWSKIHADDVASYHEKFFAAMRSRSILNVEYRVNRSEDDTIYVRDICTPIYHNDKLYSIVGVATDITSFKQAADERMRMEHELSQAQKLESVGQLAAGIAHEINTPAQFIADNLNFLQESVGELFELVKVIVKKASEETGDSLSKDIVETIEQSDMEYLSEEVPAALKQSSEGISRVATIVRAMKDYSHPGETMQLSDINAALESTMTVSSSEWKYYASINKDLDAELPLVECVISDINQVVLNMVVNASHAIVDRFDDADTMMGEIGICTRGFEDHISIEIADNGNGMSEEVKSKVFDQFFTTKQVGKGTGQGLSIAHKLIVEKHAGKIEIDSVEGEGTVFRIILPLTQFNSDEDDTNADAVFASATTDARKIA